MMDKLYYVHYVAQQIRTDGLPKPATDQSFIQNLLTIVFSTIGAVAVMMVVIGGIKYASSHGDPQSTAKAKGTVIYAVVGLVISILAVVIVDFVFGRVA